MFKEQYRDYLERIEAYLNNLSLEDNGIGKSMRYSLLGGGKRIRPVLALACADIVGGNPRDVVRAASALEMIHTYSLIHDDLPAMDDDDLRRGKPSNHKVFGEAAAILAGDALLTLAFELLAQPSQTSSERQLRVIRETAQAAGWLGMVGGQVLDTLGNGQTNTLSEIEQIHHLKTGALLKAAARLGAILGGGTEEEIDRLSVYAANIGLAFQIKDDILDIVGESEILGKPVGSDDKLAKSTYPSVLGIEGSCEHLRETVIAAKRAIEPFGAKADFLSSLADYIAERHS